MFDDDCHQGCQPETKLAGREIMRWGLAVITVTLLIIVAMYSDGVTAADPFIGVIIT